MKCNYHCKCLLWINDNFLLSRLNWMHKADCQAKNCQTLYINRVFMNIVKQFDSQAHVKSYTYIGTKKVN